MMAVISEAQRNPIDMLMYYDTRPSILGGVFDYYTLRPLKGYFPLKWFSDLSTCVYEIRTESRVKGIYSIGGVDADGKVTLIVTHYAEEDSVQPVNVELDLGRAGTYDVYLVDADHSGEHVTTTDSTALTLPVHSIVMLKER